MSGATSVIDRAVELAGDAEALACVLSIPRSRVERWIDGSEAVPRHANEWLSRCIAHSERAALRVLQRIAEDRPQARR